MADKTLLNPEGKDKLNAHDVDNMRKKLIAEYGNKIIGEPKPSWTTKEKAAQIIYKVASDQLHEMAPGTKTLDQISDLYTRNEVDGAFGLLLKYIKKGFWVIFAIAALLALVKFVFQ